jgi:general secretion pathway protein A
MYREFFNLESFPFNNNPDPRFLCMLPETKEALACLEYGVAARKGVIVMMGEVGTGKTTLLRSALNTMRNHSIRTSFIFNPRLDILECLEFMLADFGITPPVRTKSAMLLQLNRWLIERYAMGETCVLVVDEAQSLSSELLEEIRLLTNLETDSEKLLQIVLSGQPELEAKLKEYRLRQLRQRVSLWCRTFPLTQEQTADYVTGRLTTAGAKETIFLPEALDAIYSYSRGIPRLINLLCEHAMILCFVEELKQVPAGVVFAVATDLELEPYLPHDRQPAKVEPHAQERWMAEQMASHERVS